MSDELPPCDREIFERGQPLMAVDTYECRATGFDAWIQAIAKLSGQRIDWHYSGGVASVLFIGDREAIVKAVNDHPCPGRIMRWFEDGEPGLYRKGITPTPPGMIAAWYEGGPGSVFVVKGPEE